MLEIIRPGLQSTLQGAPRTRWRHLGFPASGPADPLSMALANRLVGNPVDATAIEVTYGGLEVATQSDCAVAVTGAMGEVLLSGEPVVSHETLHLKEGDVLLITPPRVGARAYLSIASGFQAAHQFGSTSTYLPAGFGGLDGRALASGDVIAALEPKTKTKFLQTPEHLRPTFTDGVVLRACRSAETDLIDEAHRAALFDAPFTAGRQPTRMGVPLEGQTVPIGQSASMKSVPVFPGTVQCPPSGTPVILSCDAQTTGGYPRIASIARCDRHLIGQIRPGAMVQLLRRSPDEALADDRRKRALFADWLGS